MRLRRMHRLRPDRHAGSRIAGRSCVFRAAAAPMTVCSYHGRTLDTRATIIAGLREILGRTATILADLARTAAILADIRFG